MTDRACSTEPRYRRSARATKLSAFHEELVQALKADALRPRRERRTARALYTQIKAAGYQGGYTRVTDFIRQWRQGAGQAVAGNAFVPLAFELGEAFQFDWRQKMGGKRYPNASALLITADGGGSNGSRCRLWKVALETLAARLGLPIHVCHFPPGTSKWNKIEHRMFSHITQNWRGALSRPHWPLAAPAAPLARCVRALAK